MQLPERQKLWKVGVTFPNCIFHILQLSPPPFLPRWKFPSARTWLPEDYFGPQQVEVWLCCPSYHEVLRLCRFRNIRPRRCESEKRTPDLERKSITLACLRRLWWMMQAAFFSSFHRVLKSTRVFFVFFLWPGKLNCVDFNVPFPRCSQREWISGPGFWVEVCRWFSSRAFIKSNSSVSPPGWAVGPEKNEGSSGLVNVLSAAHYNLQRAVFAAVGLSCPGGIPPVQIPIWGMLRRQIPSSGISSSVDCVSQDILVENEIRVWPVISV